MPTFSCPQCNKTLKTANPIPAGKKVKCPGCSHIFRMGAADETAVKAHKPVAPVRKPAAPMEGPRFGRQRPDPEDDKEVKRKMKARADEDTINDEGDEDEVPPPRSQKKKKALGKKNLFLILGGVAALLLLLALTAFVWPGFLLKGKTSAPIAKNKGMINKVAAPAVPLDPLAFVPNNTEWVAGANLAAILQGKPEYVQKFEQFFERNLSMTPAQIELMKNVERGIMAGPISVAAPQTALLAFSTSAPQDPKKVLEAFSAGTPKTLQAKKIYMVKGKGPTDKDLLSLPDNKTVVVGTMSDTEFLKALEGKGKLSPEMQAQVDTLMPKSAWFVVNLQALPKDKMPKPEDLKDAPGGPEALPAFQNGKFAGVSLDWTKDAQLQVNVECASEPDAKLVETFAKNAWEQKGKPFMGALPFFIGNQAGDEGIKMLINDVNQTFQIQQQGSTVTASITLNEKTLQELAKGNQKPDVKKQ